MNELALAITSVIEGLYGLSAEVKVERPKKGFGDYSTNIAMQIAGDIGKAPLVIAQRVAASINTEIDIVENAEALNPGFINMTVSAKWLHGQLRETDNLSAIGEGKTVLCEFPSPNIAKPFSVGHLRPAVQGWALSRLMEKCGFRVITDNHIGDYGTPYGKWVVGFLRYSSEDRLRERGVQELADIYIKVTHDMKEEKGAGGHEISDQVQEWLKRLESGDEQAIHYRDQFKKISLEHIHDVMNMLEISTDYEIPESYYVKRGQELTDQLLKRGLAVKSDGAVVVPLDSEGINTPIMLRKANGAALYATTDLATIDYREKKWKPDRVFIHTGQEQKLYFEQLNALARLAGYKVAIEHIWHGLVDQADEHGERSKMSSRKGVVSLKELIVDARKKARELMSPEASEEDANDVALGAIKFADFIADRRKGMLFDWERSFSLHGFSGPAIQYAAVRIKSILAKSGNETSRSVEDTGKYDWDREKGLLLLLNEYKVLMPEIARSYEMHKLASYLYELAREFNRYYENTPILKASPEERSCRIQLVSYALNIITEGLEILGINVPNKM